MKRIYTFGGDLVERNLTVADIIQNKKDAIVMTQVTAQNAEEAEIIADQEIDMITLLNLFMLRHKNHF